MMMRKNIHSWIVVLVVLISSCVVEKIPDLPSPESSSADIYLQIRVPGLSTPGTRALSALDENHIETLDILVFEKNPVSGVETYSYRTFARKIGDNTSPAAIRSFSLSLQASAAVEEYRIVLLANLKDEVAGAALTVGETKETTLQKITFDASAMWDVTTPRYLPMWGESSGTHVVTPSLTGTDIGTIHLFRSVARLDVGVHMDGADDTPQGLQNDDELLIETVKIVNVQGAGYPAPLAARFNPVGGESGNGIVTAPTVVSSTTTDVTYTHAVAGNGFCREIYLAEAEGSKNHTLLIGAYYTPSGETKNTTKTWYRVNLYDQTKDDPYSSLRDILRNHRYRVNITGVQEAGYATEAEALNATPANLTVQLTVYEEEGDLNHVAYNGQYQLAVTTDAFTFEHEGKTGNQLSVQTTVPTPGWDFTITDSPIPGEGNPVTWVKHTSGSFTGVGKKDKFTFDVEEGWGIKRKAYIHFTAGTLTLPVKITQKGLPNSYFLTPGGEIEIPVRKAFMVWDNEIMGDQRIPNLTGSITCGVIWEDAQNLVSVSLSAEGDRGNSSKLSVTAASEHGNAVVGLYVNNILRYSWHIWVTDYNPNTNQNGTTYPHNLYDYLFMDRNLGATTATPGVATTLGLHYQWGRKDPFPGADAIMGSISPKTIYGTQIEKEQTPATELSVSSNNVHNTLLKPFCFYFLNKTPQDWFTTQGGNKDTYQNNFLWMDEDGNKGIFDPCPDGWRVPDCVRNAKGLPVTIPWQSYIGRSWSSTNRGVSYNGDFYPDAGGYTYHTGVLNAVGNYGYYWTAAESSTEGNSGARSMVINGVGEVSGVNQMRTYGCSVRCVKDD